MRIYGPNGEEICGNMAFDYKGFTVSASTVFRPCEVAVFDNFISGEPLYTTSNIEQAILWIDGHLAQR